MRKLATALAIAAGVFLAVSHADAKPKHVFMLMTGQVVDAKPTTGFYVEGTPTKLGINPTSGVEGGKDSDLCTGSAQFELELSDGHIFRPQEGREPIPPFVHGCMSGGKFVPANREVICHTGRHQ